MRTKDTASWAGGVLVALAVALGLLTLLTGPAGAQTSGGSTATGGSVSSGDADASNNSTASGDANASNGSVASGCSTAVNNSTASGGECTTTTAAPATTAVTTPPTTPPTTGGVATTQPGQGTQVSIVTQGAGTPSRLAVTGSDANHLTQVALGLLFLGLILVALGLEGRDREPQA
jgi:hypothetical protein